MKELMEVAGISRLKGSRESEMAYICLKAQVIGFGRESPVGIQWMTWYRFKFPANPHKSI